MAKQTVVLTILDGWGYREDPTYNAILAAKTPNWNALWQQYPHTLLNSSGTAVGLPDGQMGNSEVGHMNIGLGRVVYQDYTRINQAIENGEFQRNPTLLKAIKSVELSQGWMHVVGLLSPGGIHSHINHILAMIDMAVQQAFPRVACHVFLDGRDTPPCSAMESIQRLEQKLEQHHYPPISSVVGRYYAMDRDQHWDRIVQTYDLLTQGRSDYHVASATQALEQAYQRGETDEFVAPTWVANGRFIQTNDIVIFMNFRADRARQLTQAFTASVWPHFTRTVHPKLAEFVTLTAYAIDIKAKVAFPPLTLVNSLGEYLSHRGLTQLRIAETEKYAHVTFFLNGGVEAPYPGEERCLIPSPRISHYDLKPAMSAYEVTAALTAAIYAQRYDLIVCNYANPDMVGHTGNFEATVTAIEVVDECLGQIYQAIKAINGSLLITADHGNAEYMFDDRTQQPHTAHTSRPVPLVYVGRSAYFQPATGRLCDLAPTILHIMDVNPPKEMTGQCLLCFES